MRSPACVLSVNRNLASTPQLKQDGRVLLNEIAPRPHNSGHYTMEACPVDQFENHLRAILGLPLGKGEMDVGAAIMLNILGTTPCCRGLLNQV